MFSTISNLDAHADFDVHQILMVDLMHEFELGVWKAVFAHLVRILEAEDPGLPDKLNERSVLPVRTLAHPSDALFPGTEPCRPSEGQPFADSPRMFLK